jgi:hypothetical protein
MAAVRELSFGLMVIANGPLELDMTKFDVEIDH